MESVASLLVAASMLMGQAKAPSAYEQLRGLEWMVGDQVGEYVIPEGWGGVLPVGTKVIRRSCTRWALNKSMLEIELTTTAEGHPLIKWLEIISWDSDSKQIVHSILNSGGGGGSGAWSRDGDAWVLKWRCNIPTGETLSGTSRMRSIEPGSYEWTIVDAKANGQKVADIPVVRFQSTDLAAANGAPAEHSHDVWCGQGRPTDCRPDQGRDERTGRVRVYSPTSSNRRSASAGSEARLPPPLTNGTRLRLKLRQEQCVLPGSIHRRGAGGASRGPLAKALQRVYRSTCAVVPGCFRSQGDEIPLKLLQIHHSWRCSRQLRRPIQTPIIPATGDKI